MNAYDRFNRICWIMKFINFLWDKGILNNSKDSVELEERMCFVFDNKDIEVEITDRFLEIFLRIEQDTQAQRSLKCMRLIKKFNDKPFKLNKEQKNKIVKEVVDYLKKE